MRLSDLFSLGKASKGSEAATDEDASSPRKWLPIIDTDSCTGCRRCVNTCEHGCLGMEWDFAVLQQPHRCDSEGACMEACPHDVIRMGWVTMQGPGQMGRWRSPTAPATVDDAAVATHTSTTKRDPRPMPDGAPAIARGHR